MSARGVVAASLSSTLLLLPLFPLLLGGAGCRCVERGARGGDSGSSAGRAAARSSPRPHEASGLVAPTERARPSTASKQPAQPQREKLTLPAIIGASRPTRVYAPRALRDGDSKGKRYPLVLMLHGYGSNGLAHARGLGYLALVERAPLLLLAPDGRLNRVKRRFWHADRLCCDFFDEGKDDDDARYLRRLIERMIASYPVDRRRIYVVGHSNGGNMAYRLACFASDLLAAVVSFAGTSERRGCAPRQPLSVLQIHGDADPVVPFKPAARRRPLGRVVQLPGAIATLSLWARFDRCKGTLGAGSTLAQHITARSFAGCPPHVEATLWTVRGGDHTSRLLPRFAERTWRWLSAHRSGK